MFAVFGDLFVDFRGIFRLIFADSPGPAQRFVKNLALTRPPGDQRKPQPQEAPRTHPGGLGRSPGETPGGFQNIAL